MSIKADTYYDNGTDLSTICESDKAGNILTPDTINNFSYPRCPPSSSAAGSIVSYYKITTNLYNGSYFITLPKVGTVPTFNSKLLYSGSSDVNISRTDSVLTIGSSKFYTTDFYQNVIPKILLILIAGGGGAGAGSTNLYTGGGGGGSGGFCLSVVNVDSTSPHIKMGQGGTSSAVAAGNTVGSGTATTLYLDSNHTKGVANGGSGGGVVTGGGGGGAGGSASGGQVNKPGGAGGGGSGSANYSGDRGDDWHYIIDPYEDGIRKRTIAQSSAPAGTGGRSGGGGGASAFSEGGNGSAMSAVAQNGNMGAGGGGGGCKNGLFGANSTGGTGGSGYCQIYGGYSK